MKTKNQILNYFVAPANDNSPPRVFLSPVTMNASVGKKLIESQIGTKMSHGNKFLHVCLDLDSKRLYIPNASDFMKEQIRVLLEAAKNKIVKDFGEIKEEAIIEGSPFSSIRIRNVGSFSYVKEAIVKHFCHEVDDIAVIEANLARMPTTRKSLPCIYHNNKNFVGGYIGTEVAKSITFYDEVDIRGKLKKQ
jgi:hypothetical protein